MRRSVVKEKWRQQQAAMGVGLHIPEPAVFELASLMGFDFIWLDLEHHAISVETANNLIRAARVGRTDVMCRPAKGEFFRLGRLLEAGAHGILYPRCDNAEEAREVVRWSKFAPLGTRGYDGSNPDMPYLTGNMAEYLRKANEETWLVIQIEDPKALEHADEIAAVEGVDALMLGPADFGILAGHPGQFEHSVVWTAMERVKHAAERHGKVWGSLGLGTPWIERLVRMGAQWLTCGFDIAWIRDGMLNAQREMKELGFHFDNQLTTKDPRSLY